MLQRLMSFTFCRACGQRLLKGASFGLVDFVHLSFLRWVTSIASGFARPCFIFSSSPLIKQELIWILYLMVQICQILSFHSPLYLWHVGIYELHRVKNYVFYILSHSSERKSQKSNTNKYTLHLQCMISWQDKKWFYLIEGWDTPNLVDSKFCQPVDIFFSLMCYLIFLRWGIENE